MRELYQKSSSWSPNRCSFHLSDFLSFNFWVHRCHFVLIYLSVIEISRLLCWSIGWIMVRNLKKDIGYEKIVLERPGCQVCHADWGIGCTKFQRMKSSYSETGGACVDTIFFGTCQSDDGQPTRSGPTKGTENHTGLVGRNGHRCRSQWSYGRVDEITSTSYLVDLELFI
jgi:hypothetical protein